MKRSELLIEQLCREIDMLTFDLEESKENEKYWRDEYNKVVNESIAHSKQMIGAVLTSVLVDKSIVKDTP